MLCLGWLFSFSSMQPLWGTMDGGGWVKKNLALTAFYICGFMWKLFCGYLLVVTDGGWWIVVVDGVGWSKKSSLISLKLGTLVVQDKIMCGNFKFSDFDQKMLKKFRFKFEIWEKFYKGFPCKIFFPWESFVKWTQIKIKGNSFVKFSAGGLRSIYK